MTPIPISAERDHLLGLMKAASPLDAIAELIWNGLDADATQVSVELDINALGALDKVIVSDNGDGISEHETSIAFGKLGGSWKRNQPSTPRFKRSVHGKNGQGRFRAFFIGNLVEWQTCYEGAAGSRRKYTVYGNTALTDVFGRSESIPTLDNKGTTVTISEFAKEPRSLVSDNAAGKLTEEFAIYLSQYKGLAIFYDGQLLDPADAQLRCDNLGSIQVEVTPGERVAMEVTVIEWKVNTERALFLCDENGVTWAKVKPGIQAPGFTFTAYLKSNYVRELDKQGMLIFGEEDNLYPPLAKLLDAAKGQLRGHFQERALEETASLVAQWKAENVYPYLNTPVSPLEEAEHKLFNLCAVNIHTYLEDFRASSSASRRFTLQLVKQTLQQNPEALQGIIESVLKLPKDHQEELARLLKRTSLSAIIEASKVVSNRLDFLSALEHLVFDSVAVECLKERTQLHRILASETWIFGEEYNLSVDDEGLTSVLQAHLKLIDRQLTRLTPVYREDGSTGIVDLMLSRKIPQPKATSIHHLVIELKAPKVPIDGAAIDQLMSYATAVDEDPRFHGLNVKWDFWAVSSEVSKSVEKFGNQRGRADGLVWESDDGRMRLWVKPWNGILAECKARLEFYKQRLNIEVGRDSGREYLQRTHAKYLPEKLLVRPPGAPLEEHLLGRILLDCMLG